MFDHGGVGREKSIIGTSTLRVLSASCSCSCSILRSAFKATGATMSANNASISSDEISSGFAIGEGISGMTSCRASLKDTDLVSHGGGRTDTGGVSGLSTLRS